MARQVKDGGLTSEEKSIVKALLGKGWRNQDIQAILNLERKATVNSGRITEVKKDQTISAASDESVEFFKVKKQSYHPKTGLNLFNDERLIRAREAMILAVQIFNSPSICFKSEVFTMLANVAWTYLLHEYYIRKNIKVFDKSGVSLFLKDMLKRHDCPLSQGIKDNISSLKKLRDEVEHQLLGRADQKWLSLFQACCLNFDRAICDLFGKKTLSHELSFSLQFSKVNFEQVTALNQYEIPNHIEGVDARLLEGMTQDRIDSLEYKFRVIYTLDKASKSTSNVQFIVPESKEGQEIHNILVQKEISDDLYPYKAGKVVRLVKERAKRRFTLNGHTEAWRKFKIRPGANASDPKQTNKTYCIYHAAHRDYTYSEDWVTFLVNQLLGNKGEDISQNPQKLT